MEYDLQSVPLTENFYLTTYKLENEKQTTLIKAKFIGKTECLNICACYVKKNKKNI